MSKKRSKKQSKRSDELLDIRKKKEQARIDAAKPAVPAPAAKPAEAEPKKSEAEPKKSEAEPKKAEAKPAAAEEKKPAPAPAAKPAEAEPKKSEAEPKKSEAEPKKSDAEPKKAEAKPAAAEEKKPAPAPAAKPAEAEPKKVEAEPKKAEAKPAAAEEKKAAEAPKKAEAEKKPAAAPAAKQQPKESKEKEETMSDNNFDLPTPRRSVAFIGSECYPFVKTGGLGDVMYALPKALAKLNCDVKVILPRYRCIPQEYQEKMVYKGSFDMDLCADGTRYYVGIMEYVWDGVVYDFIDNEFFFTAGDPYVNLVDDIPKFCYFGKAALAALNYLDWIPDVIHCHDWQAGLVPIYLREFFGSTPLARSKVILTIHNLRFQGKYDIQMISYWSNLPMHLFNKDVLKEGYDDANMMKGGLTYSNMITTVSGTYAGEIQTQEYGEGLDGHLRYHSGKLRGIVNGIDYDMWNPAQDSLLAATYDVSNVLEQKRK
ncbi:MAG: glycogen synthase, partial [Lachnospiraceae bacterium]|nr:glycogen synthase [Lachnospiraceae bacterium]